jgi:3-hydroxy-9,10-secoandrosta-1,3,5(10)-triene-9,17-dione monooxygenase
MQRAADDERKRRVADATMEAIVEAGLLRALRPRRWGGYEMDPGVAAEIQIALGDGDMSTAWLYGVFVGHAFHLALFDPRAQAEVWGENPEALIASSYAPVGKAVRVPGGVRLTGHWKFASGSDHAHWFMLGGMHTEAPHEHRIHLVRRRDCRIEDAWHVMGLKATGSQDVIVEDLFVPDYATLSHTDTMVERQPGQTLNTAPLFGLPYIQMFFRGITTGSIGGLQAMLREFLAYGARKVDKTGKSLVDNPDAQMACAQAALAIEDMKVAMHRDFEEMMRYARAGTKPSITERLTYRYRASEVTSRCVRHARDLFVLAGGSGIYDDTLPFARICRNLEAAEAHPAAQHRACARSLGRYLLTGELVDRMI